MEVTLSSQRHPENGTVTIPFPIPSGKYDSYLKQVQELGMGDAVAQDCHVDRVVGALPVLACLEGRQANLDELDYLAHCVEDFLGDEPFLFEAAASALGLNHIRDLINLTQSMQSATIVRDFSSDRLAEKVREQYLRMNGSAPASELNSIGLAQMMKELFASGKAQVTPYGVFFGNGMELRQLYTGRSFPARDDAAKIMAVVLSREAEPEDYTLLHLPVPDSYLARAVIRGGLENEERLRLHMYAESDVDEIVNVLGEDHTITLDSGFLEELNGMCRAAYSLPATDLDKLGAVICFAEPQNASEIQRLAENLGMFEYVPKVQTPEEYAKHLLKDSGLLREDQELAAFFDYKAYGEQQANLYDGRFSERGYVALHASITLEELLMDDPSEPGVKPTIAAQVKAMRRKMPKAKRRKTPER